MRLERDVAIKVVRAELLSDPDARTRFRREAQLVARLQHPGIVSVFDYGTLPDGAAFLVMEYVRGRDLRAVLRADGPMAPDRVTRLLRAIAAPVEAAHALGVLHRDLKPENILLPEGDVGAKVLDFGVAKLLGGDGTAPENETLTLAGQPIGTPAYMAPEQLAGASVSTRTDVFALGAIAYELLTGAPPFGRGPLVEIATRHRTGPGPIEREDVSPHDGRGHHPGAQRGRGGAPGISHRLCAEPRWMTDVNHRRRRDTEDAPRRFWAHPKKALCVFESSCLCD